MPPENLYQTETAGENRKACLHKGIGLALTAACLYAINAPISKLFLSSIGPAMMAGFLYLGTGLGMALLLAGRKLLYKENREAPLEKNELPYIVGMVVLDIAAPILLMMGLQSCSAANASLLNNFEIVATALIALFVFHESISRRLWLGIGFVTLSCLILSFEDSGSLQFSKGSLLVLGAALSWGLENNCTRKLSEKDPLEIVLIKGLFSGSGSLLIGLFSQEQLPALNRILPVLLLGFVAYGLSIYCYVYAQRYVGAARTSAYYAVAPFIASFLSLLIFRQIPNAAYWTALVFMMIGAWLSGGDGPVFRRRKK